MIPLEIKQESNKVSLPANTQNNDEIENSLSFEKLLQGVKEADSGKKEIQNGAFVVALEDSAQKSETKSQKTALEMLLSADDVDIEALLDSDTALELNPKITNQLSTTELKQLISDAKNYLKEQITSSEGFLRSEASELPKTLKGLTQFAQKLGIDLSKITYEEVQTTQSSLDNERAALKKESSEQKFTANNIANYKEENKHTDHTEPVVTKQFKVKQKSVLPPQTVQNKAISKDEISSSDKKLSIQQEGIKSSTAIEKEPLFQAQSKREVSTQELVGVKLQTQQSSPTEKKRQKADETLKLLLQGQSASKGNEKTFLTQDFSSATAPVIAPKVTQESDVSLESLLNGELSEADSSEVVKSETSSKVLKADSFEVKLNEAKQMTKYLSQDVKNAIDNYKAPFTRLKVQLNPERLGEIELTVVQRGKNLHVNLSSNNAAINALAMNANDLKVQLQNSGINNASLNFSNNSQEQAASQQQQQQHSRQEANSEYSFFEHEEQNEEIISSLEIVVPYYA